MKTWKKLVPTENDIEFEYSDKFERPVLAYQGLFLLFSAVFCKNGALFKQERVVVQEERLLKIWRKGTGHDNVPFHVCLQFLTDLVCQGISLTVISLPDLGCVTPFGGGHTVSATTNDASMHMTRRCHLDIIRFTSHRMNIPEHIRTQ